MSSSATLLMSANAALSMNSSARPQLSRYREMYTLRMVIMKTLSKFKLYGTAVNKPDLHSKAKEFGIWTFSMDWGCIRFTNWTTHYHSES